MTDIIRAERVESECPLSLLYNTLYNVTDLFKCV